jgi:hypothetical protein
MTAKQQQQQKQWEDVGRQFDDLYLFGNRDFEAFKALFRRAIAINGPKDDGLEMFTASIKEPAWQDWMRAEIDRMSRAA